VKRSK